LLLLFGLTQFSICFECDNVSTGKARVVHQEVSRTLWLLAVVGLVRQTQIVFFAKRVYVEPVVAIHRQNCRSIDRSINQSVGQSISQSPIS